jgi:hypothetical protein
MGAAMRRVPIVLIAIALLTIAFIWFRPINICQDEVRTNFEKTEGYLQYIKGVKAEIGSTVGLQRVRYFEELDNLTTSSFAALQYCSTDCKILERCLRWSFKASAAEACPKDLANYRSRVEQVLVLLPELEKLQAAAANAKNVAEELKTVDAQVEEAKSSPDATGGRLAVLKAKQQLLDGNLMAIGSEMAQLANNAVEVAKE